MTKINYSILKDDLNNTVFTVLKDEMSNTTASVVVKNEKGEDEVKAIYIPSMYISATTYRKLFRTIYPQGRISTEILHKPNGDNFTINTFENKGRLTQEIVKVKLYETREDQANDLPISEGYGSICYRGEEIYNNNGLSIAQGKAFSNAMKNLGICIEDTEEARKEMLENIQAYIEVPCNSKIENSGSSTYYKAIGTASKFYDELQKAVYSAEETEIILQKEDPIEATEVVQVEEIKKEQQKVISDCLNATEYEEIVKEKVDIENEEQDEIIDLSDPEKTLTEESENVNELKKAMESKFNLKSSCSNIKLKEMFDGVKFKDLILKKGVAWMETLGEIKEQMTVKTAKMYDILAENNFAI